MDGRASVTGGLKEASLLSAVIDNFSNIIYFTDVNQEDEMYRALWESHYWLTEYYNKYHCEHFRRYDVREEHRNAAKYTRDSRSL